MSDAEKGSFIPKNPVRGSSRPRPVRRLYLISIVASIFFVTTVFASGGIFVYTLSLEQTLRAEQDRLSEVQSNFNQGDLEQVLEFEARLQAANTIFSQQVYLPALFTALEQTAIPSTAYTGLAYEKDAMNNLLVTLETRNPTLNGVRFQREVLASNQVLQGATVSEITLVSEGGGNDAPQSQRVAFTISHEPRGALLQQNQTGAAALPSADTTSNTPTTVSSTTTATNAAVATSSVTNQ